MFLWIKGDKEVSDLVHGDASVLKHFFVDRDKIWEESIFHSNLPVLQFNFFSLILLAKTLGETFEHVFKDFTP